MRILIINHEYPPVGGGAANASKHIAKELVRIGLQVDLITSRFRDLPHRETQDGVNIIRVPALRSSQLEASSLEVGSFAAPALFAALGLVSRRRPDVIHAFFGVPSGALGCALRALTGIPYLISLRGRDVHGGKAPQCGGIAGPLRAVSRIVWRRAGAVVANSHGLRQVALQVEPRVHVDVIPNGIDTNRFTPAPTDGPADSPLRLLFVGRLEPYKGLDFLLEALGLLQARTDRRFVLRIVGDGSLRDELPQVAQRLGVQGCVDFAGLLSPEQMPDAYRSADVFVLPSVVEGMPNVVLEAMASALPVVATRIPGCEELVVPGQTGFLAEPASTGSLADALLALIENRSLRDAMGRSARREAEGRSWGRVAQAYISVYRHLAGNSYLGGRAYTSESLASGGEGSWHPRTADGTGTDSH